MEDTTHVMASNHLWRKPPAELSLSNIEVHIWRARLDLSPPQIRNLQLTLSFDELERAGRFHRQKDCSRFIAARGILRDILSRYLPIEPKRLSFSYDSYGKPALAVALNQEELAFNLSHSDGLALYSFTRGRDIGIDLERIQEGLEIEQIAKRFFSHRENEELKSVPFEKRAKAFFNCWTRKEAFIKAKGIGLSMRLDMFDVSLIPDKPALLLDTRYDTKDASRWMMQALNPETGYAGTLVVEGHGLKITQWDW